MTPKRLLLRAYAPQRLASYRRMEERQRAEEERRNAWAWFYFCVVAGLVIAGFIG